MVDIVMPKWGLTMEEGTIVEWLKQVGEPVREGEPVLVVETEKASGEVEAPASGVLGEILHPAGAVVPVGQVVGRIYTEAEWAARGG